MGGRAHPRPARAAGGARQRTTAAARAHRALRRAAAGPSVPADGGAVGAAARYPPARAGASGAAGRRRSGGGDPRRAARWRSWSSSSRERSEGIPLFVEELAGRHARRTRGPRLPAAVAARRADRPRGALSPGRAARAARRLSRRSLGARPPARARRRAARARAARWLCARRWITSCWSSTRSGRGYGFRHALARGAIHEDLLPGERIQLHRAYAEAIEDNTELAGPDLDASSMLAHHWLAAHDVPRALPASVRAGRAAAAAAAPSAAQLHFELRAGALEQVPDAESRAGTDHSQLLEAAASAAARAGAVDRGLALVDQALAEVGYGGPLERRATLLVRRAEMFARSRPRRRGPGGIRAGRGAPAARHSQQGQRPGPGRVRPRAYPRRSDLPGRRSGHTRAGGGAGGRRHRGAVRVPVHRGAGDGVPRRGRSRDGPARAGVRRGGAGRLALVDHAFLHRTVGRSAHARPLRRGGEDRRPGARHGRAVGLQPHRRRLHAQQQGRGPAALRPLGCRHGGRRAGRRGARGVRRHAAAPARRAARPARPAGAGPQRPARGQPASA